MEPADIIETIMLGQSGLQWAASYRRSRIRLLTSDNSPFLLADGCAFFLHIVPWRDRVPINFRDDKYLDAIRKHGMLAETSQCTYNSDGLMRYRTQDSGKISNYLLYMRSGIIEQCMVYLPNAEKYIPGQLMDNFLLYNIADDLEALTDMGQSYPMVVFVTLVGAKGWTIAGTREATPIDRNEVWIEAFDFQDRPKEHDKGLAPLLDAIWNCSGAARSPHI